MVSRFIFISPKQRGYAFFVFLLIDFFFFFLIYLLSQKQESEEIKNTLEPLVKAAGGTLSPTLPPALRSPSSPLPFKEEEEEPFCCDDLSKFFCISSSLTGVPEELHAQTFETEFVKLSVMRQKLETEGNRTKVGRRRGR